MNNSHLLPPNATPMERAISQAASRGETIPTPLRELWDPWTCPESHLPWLAWALSVDTWEAGWPAARKRAVIDASYTVHKHKGTVAAMRAAVAALGYGIELVEWHQESPPAAPYTFGLTAELTGQQIGVGIWDEVEKTALAAKNVRSHLRYVRARSRTQGSYYVGGTAISAEIVTVHPYQVTEIISRGRYNMAGAVTVVEVVTISASPPPVLTMSDGAVMQMTDLSLLKVH